MFFFGGGAYSVWGEFKRTNNNFEKERKMSSLGKIDLIQERGIGLNYTMLTLRFYINILNDNFC